MLPWILIAALMPLVIAAYSDVRRMVKIEHETALDLIRARARIREIEHKEAGSEMSDHDLLKERFREFQERNCIRKGNET